MKMKRVGIAVMLATLTLASGIKAADMQLPELKTQPNPQAVLDEHLDALNKCDWNRLLAQYPEDAQIHVPNGTVITGRKAIGELFAGFCKEQKDGGLNGINFKAVQSTLIGGTFATHWVASAPFLVESYHGSDAYITKDGLMQAMVTTFDGAALKIKK
jgi:SnoaL-like domain